MLEVSNLVKKTIEYMKQMKTVEQNEWRHYHHCMENEIYFT